jgi:hypothetical protein
MTSDQPARRRRARGRKVIPFPGSWRLEGRGDFAVSATPLAKRRDEPDLLPAFCAEESLSAVARSVPQLAPRDKEPQRGFGQARAVWHTMEKSRHDRDNISRRGCPAAGSCARPACASSAPATARIPSASQPSISLEVPQRLTFAPDTGAVRTL